MRTSAQERTTHELPLRSRMMSIDEFSGNQQALCEENGESQIPKDVQTRNTQNNHVNVITLAAASYRDARRTLRSRCLRALKDAVEKKLKLPHAAARAKDLGAKHIIFAMSSNGAFSKSARDFFNTVKQHV